MTQAQFCQLSPRAQFLHVLTVGTYLAARWAGAGKGAMYLYFVPDEESGFYAEVGIADLGVGIVVLRSFSDSEALEDYAHYVQLPNL